MFFHASDVIFPWATLMKTVLMKFGMEVHIKASAKRQPHGLGWHLWANIVIVDFVVMLPTI